MQEPTALTHLRGSPKAPDELETNVQDLAGFTSPPESPNKARGPASPHSPLGLIPESDDPGSQQIPVAPSHNDLAQSQLVRP